MLLIFTWKVVDITDLRRYDLWYF